MQWDKLKPGDTIGMVSPSHIVEEERCQNIIRRINELGFKVKVGNNIYKDTYGYIASEYERADDFNQMIYDNDVKMVLFGGGFGAVDILPLIDYNGIKQNPKIFLSYSYGTSILNAIYAKTGLKTFYGQAPGNFEDLRLYDYKQFSSHFLQEYISDFVSNSEWISLCGGVCEGTLIGGYTWNFALLLNTEFLSIDPYKKYVLFLEDNERFTNIAGVSMLISHIEQSKLAENISGMLFGHYSENRNPYLLERLKRFGEKHSIPVAYCDDFGHGKNHAIIPIGVPAQLDTRNNTMTFLD